MNKIAALISTGCALLMVTTLPVYASSGGEQGNGKYAKYVNRLANFETYYPASWDYFDLESTVSFVEGGVDLSEASIVSITLDQIPNLVTVEELEHYLAVQHPDQEWEKTSLGEKPAYQNLDRSKGIIYVLKGEGILLTIQYRIRENAKAKEEVTTIVESLKME
ncbi:MAG: hypothetical protein HY391_02660 [Deltaproteobacteria bacterium]|nr:hypothetical protein [Deltaproteobacteria bacterium]